MKKINNYIIEKLNLGKAKTYTCQPQTKDELREILEKRLAKDKNADLNDIDVSKITDMGIANNKEKGLFEELDPHDIDISAWDVSNVTNMSYMFYECINFNSDLSDWDVSNVTDMRFMFLNCKNFNSNLSKWNVGKVIYMNDMFGDCKEFNSDLNKWNISNVESMIRMFAGCESLKKRPKWYK